MTFFIEQDSEGTPTLWKRGPTSHVGRGLPVPLIPCRDVDPGVLTVLEESFA